MSQLTPMEPNSAISGIGPALRWLTFFNQWLRNPRHMASVVPSGRQLGRLMAAALPSSDARVIELGAGTGAITHALIDHGIAMDSLLVVEMNPVLHGLLEQRFPNIHVVCGDARHLESLVKDRYAFSPNNADVVCSSLGLLAMPKELQQDIVAAAFNVLNADGVFIQYTYGPRPPLHEDVLIQLRLKCSRSSLAWRNLPPARVYVYSRQSLP